MINRRLAIILLLSIPIIILSVVLIKDFDKDITNRNFSERMALDFYAECDSGVDMHRVYCLEVKIISYISSFPAETGNVFATFWETGKSGKLSDDMRIFSDIAHKAGMVLANSDISLDKALSFCGTTFKQGCIHGVIMEYIDNKYPSEIEASTLFDFCGTVSDENYIIYINCLHGVGHILAAKSRDSIQSILGLCDPLSAEESFACASGVLMEYSKGTAGSGAHAHTPVGKKELPCVELDDEYKSVCYASAGSYRQYQPGQEDFSKSYNFCLNSPEEYIDDCLIGLSERAILASAENQEKLNDICAEIENQDARFACVDSIQKLLEIPYL